MALCSIAAAAGIVGVVMLVKRAFWRRRFMMAGGAPWGMAYAGGCGPGAGHGFGGHDPGWGGPPPWAFRHGHGHGPRHGGFGRSRWLRALFARLDTTPGQEKEIRSALEELEGEVRSAKDELRGAREGVARAVASEVFDEIAVGEATVKLDASTGRAKHAFEAALRRIHATLDAKQRERLAELLEKGPRGWSGGFGPYR